MGLDYLIENVDSQIIKIRTKSLDVSFNELYDMYTDGELKIHPDYQRLFRWDEEKQSRFIESLILEMPVPPIFVIEVDDGIYELIDGLQRISSYLHFRGAKLEQTDISDEENKTMLEPLVLSGCDIVPELNGTPFENMPKALQIKLKRSFVRMEVIRKESEPSLKYHMFKRLNNGGEELSEQEVRNCTIRLLGTNSIQLIEECAKNKYFMSVIKKIREKELKSKFDQELVLRFFALKNNLDSYRYPFSEFLTDYMESITKGSVNFNFEQEKVLFEKVFQKLFELLGEDVFSSKTKSDGIKNDFVLYYYDAITIAMSRHTERFERKIDADDFKDKIDGIKFGAEIKNLTGGGGGKSGTIGRIALFDNEMSDFFDQQ